jgi:hypothetical protein
VKASATEENAIIQAMMTRVDFFIANNNVFPYLCVPELLAGTFNSNSFVRGLLDAIPVQASGFNPFRFVEFPGWANPIPAIYYGVTP